jgi:hypothetical protein
MVRSETTSHQVVTNRTTENEIHSQQQSIDEFLESISIPIQQPLVQDVPQSPQVVNSNIGRKNQREAELSTQRKSTRLAKKAELNVGKDAMQVAQDLLIRKLGELAGDETNTDELNYDFYAQHFERPIEQSKMEAIQVLIEQGNKKMRKGSNMERRTAEVGLDA